MRRLQRHGSAFCALSLGGLMLLPSANNSSANNQHVQSCRRPLEGRVALVTGGSRGIGSAVAVALADAGAAVAVNYRERAAEAHDVVQTIQRAGGQAMLVGADVSQANEVSTMVAAVEQQLGPVDILVNNAGIGLQRGLDDLTEEDFDRTIAVNLKSAFLVLRQCCLTCGVRGGVAL